LPVERTDALPTVLTVAVGAVLLALYVLLGSSTVATSVVYEVASIGAAVVTAFALRRRLRIRRSPWRGFCLGFGLYAAGDLSWCLRDSFGVGAVPARLSDACYLAAYPAFAWMVAGSSAVWRERLDTTFRQLVDALLLFVSAYCAAWFFGIDPIIESHRTAGLDEVLSVLYPTLDLMLLALVARFVFSSHRWPWSWRLLAAGFVAMFGADLAWRLMLANGTYSISSWLNTLFVAAYVLWAAGVVHPSSVEIQPIGRAAVALADVPRAPRRRLALLAVAAVVPGVVLFLGGDRIRGSGDVTLFACAIVLLPLLSLARVGDMVRVLRRVATEADLARVRMEAILRASPVATCVVDRTGTVHLWNRAAEEASGFTAEEIVGGPPPVNPGEDPERIAELYAQALQGVVLEDVEVKLLHRDGRPLDVRVSTAPLDTADGQFVALFDDVTRELQQQQELDHLANHDPLTGLPNRRRFERELDALERDPAASASTWIALLDVDNFKSVNDTAGHAVGDRVLRELADLLPGEFRPDDFIARLSGDEFALILRGLEAADAVDVVERLLDAARDYRLVAAGETIDLTLSAGVARLDRGVRAQLALKHADEALYQAKNLGKNRLERWTPHTHESVETARRWSPVVKDALRDGRIEVALQPIVALAGGAVAFYESLCRLRTPQGEIVEAQRFVDAAERAAIMPALDLRMLERVEELLCEDDALRIFVNLGPSSFHDSRILSQLRRTLARVRKGSLGIEITEHTALSRPERMRAELEALIELGAIVAIDDFGLGFTSFHELATLPCHMVKIPAALTQSADAERRGAVIAAAITHVAHAFGKEVVLEGIETSAAHERARRGRIEYGQGWFYGRPLLAAELLGADLAEAAASAT
jgi:diguanylate cyclase (GGDEF)-like protein/PAS domain S-box-containing protein